MGLTKNTAKVCIGRSVRVLPMLRRSLTEGLTIFCFHDVTDNPSRFDEEYGLAVSIDTFNRQISWISNNFDIIHPESLLTGTNLPKRCAMISFDDGFLGTFENGLEILKKLTIPSIVFLNMQAIIEQKPMLSAVACFLNRNVPEFSQFAKSHGILPPYHLTLTPKTLKIFEEKFYPIDRNEVLRYQGIFADMQMLKKWNCRDFVVYGNHLYDHWNATALGIEEFEGQYTKNKIALAQLKNSIHFFAFPNGQPATCFTIRHVELLAQLGAQRVFSASGGNNRDVNKYLLGRMSLSEPCNEDHIWFRMFYSTCIG